MYRILNKVLLNEKAMKLIAICHQMILRVVQIIFMFFAIIGLGYRSYNKHWYHVYVSIYRGTTYEHRL